MKCTEKIDYYIVTTIENQQIIMIIYSQTIR